MMKRTVGWGIQALAFAALPALPLLGAYLAGEDLCRYARFPPPPPATPPPGFSLVTFLGMGLLVALCVAPPLLFSLWCVKYTKNIPPRPTRRFPVWGWAAGLLMAVSWGIAWWPADALAPLRRHSFTPLWLGYALIVSALTQYRTGSCLMTRRPMHWVLLFPTSASFWWFFEFLNRFVHNWYYEGVGQLTPFGYAIFASLPFATVLPSVLGTHELLASFPRLGAGLDCFVPLPMLRPRLIALLGAIVAAASLLLLPLFPNQLYPLLWVAPLLLFISARTLASRPHVLSPLAQGRWRHVCLIALAGLVCGFFWEMWNMYSLARWRYAVPYVGVLHIFEMPLLGFAGYLSFGLECAMIADLVLPGPERSYGDMPELNI